MKRQHRRIGLAVLGLVLLLAGISVVVPRLLRAPSWPKDAVLVPRDEQTLQAALDRVSSGGTIVLQSQASPLEGPVTVSTPNVAILGATPNIQLSGDGSSPALSILADGVTVRNLEITGGSVGIYVEASQCELEDLVVRGAPVGIQLLAARGCGLRNVEIHEGRVGCELLTSDGNSLQDVTVTHMEDAGVRMLGAWNNILERALVTDTPVGISLEQGAAENEVTSTRTERTPVAAVSVQSSNDNRIQDATLIDAGVGVSIEWATGTTVRGCRIDQPVTAGILLAQALQNRVEENEIQLSGGLGIHLTQSAENAISYNRIEGVDSTGIEMDGSDRNLLRGNSFRGMDLGLHLVSSDANSLLRNHLSGSVRAGMLLSQASENRLLDNAILDGAVGALLSSAKGNTLLRNRVEGQSAVSLLVGTGSSLNRLQENRILESATGLLISGSRKDDVLANLMSGNVVGLQLVAPGGGLRIEGNTLEANETGLAVDDAPVDVQRVVERELGIQTWNDASEFEAPVLTNNTFLRNQILDIRLPSELRLYAAGNWWGEERERNSPDARVSDGVDLAESAWLGTLAIGTESDTTQVVLGRVLQLLLEEQGYRVIDLVGMGNGPRMQQALRSGDVDLVWWVDPEEDAASWAVQRIPATDGWIGVAAEHVAAQLPEATMTALAALATASGERWTLSVPRSFGEEALASLIAAYGLDGAIGSISWTETLEEAEALLKFGIADLAIVGNLEETLTRSGFTAVDDDLDALHDARLAVVLRQQLVEQSPGIVGVVSDLAPRLTATVLHDLTSLVRLLHREPKVVAAEFLAQEGLLPE